MYTKRDAESQDEPSDEALLNAIAGGEVWAMDSLYQRYSRILYSLAYRMVADHQVAEDLLQDAGSTHKGRDSSAPGLMS